MKESIELLKQGRYTTPGEFYVFRKIFKYELQGIVESLYPEKLSIDHGKYAMYCSFSIKKDGFTKFFTLCTGNLLEMESPHYLKISEVRGFLEYPEGYDRIIYINDKLKESLNIFVNKN